MNEEIFGLALICFLSVVCAYIAADTIICPAVRNTIAFFKGKIALRKIPKATDIPLEDVQKILDTSTFLTMLKEASTGNLKGEKLGDDSVVEVLYPCRGHDCPEHTTRADCCNSYKEVGGKVYCRVLVNLENGQEVGIARNSDKLLTEAEAKLISDKLVEFIQEIRK